MTTYNSIASNDADYLWNFADYLCNEKKISFTTKEHLQYAIKLALLREDTESRIVIQSRNDFLDHLTFFEKQGIITQETKNDIWNRMFFAVTKRSDETKKEKEQ